MIARKFSEAGASGNTGQGWKAAKAVRGTSSVVADLGDGSRLLAELASGYFGVPEGQMRRGFRTGLGCAEDRAGVRYQGHWRNNQRNGLGVEITPDGIYEGQFTRLWPLRVIQEDLRDGFGVFAKTKGSTYTGEWKKVPAPRRACPDTLWTEAGISLKRCSSTDTPVCVSTHHAADYKGIS
ncbi:hypothetical protein T484DRAFT_3449281 [Baffinella frigidus]|nr:hypothetical protein T484DRAFT_3449281 [Cryptophyta sp. CCMP2293]